MKLDTLAEGVIGYAMEHEGAIYYPFVDTTEKGKGYLSRFLDSLPTDKTIKFPTVISKILRASLMRRSFKIQFEWAEEFGEMAEVFVKEATQ